MPDSKLTKARIALMMFLQYFIWGSWYVTLGTFLARGLHFHAQEIGLAAGSTAIGAIVSPFLVGMIADRTLATQKLLGMLHLFGAALLFIAARQSSFAHFYGAILLYSICYMPTLSLTNSLAMRQMREPKGEFGPIRVLGTIGWIAAGLLVGNLGLESSAMPLKIASASSVLMGLYCFSLPDTPPLARTGPRPGALSLEAIGFLKTRAMAAFVTASFLICIPLQFYYAFTNLYLNEIGVSNAAAKMTGGQMSELFFMLFLSSLFTRLGVKGMLAVAMLAWVVRYLFFAFGNDGTLLWMLWGGILLHGVCYDFFFVTGQIFIDQKAPAALRAAAQGLITLITYGVGMFAGSWISGRVVEAYNTGTATHDWRHIWLFPAACSAIVLAGFLLTFNERSRGERSLEPAGAGAR